MGGLGAWLVLGREMLPVTQSLSEFSEKIKSRQGQASIPEKNRQILWQVTGRKCSCRLVWCPACWDRFLKSPLVKRLRSMAWGHVRHVEFSIDRKFTSGREAYLFIMQKRGIAQMLKDFARTDGIPINDAVWVLEWHKDGYPHFHVFIDVGIAGPAGMIGQRLLHARWPWGLWVHESPIKSENHWNSVVGYFDRKGYFEGDKGHQGRLPEWGLRGKMKIRRWGSMRGRIISDEAIARIRQELRSSGGQCFGIGDLKGNGVFPATEHPPTLEARTSFTAAPEHQGEGMQSLSMLDKDDSILPDAKNYGSLLEDCGRRSWVTVTGSGSSENELCDIAYADLRESFPWEYVKGRGLMMFLVDETEVRLFRDCLSLLLAPTSQGHATADRMGARRVVRKSVPVFDADWRLFAPWGGHFEKGRKLDR